MPGLRAREQQRVRHVVAVAQVRERAALEPAEPLADREQVGERLARMLEVGQGVDDRDRGGRGEDLQPLLLERPQHDRVDVAADSTRPVSSIVSPRPSCSSVDEITSGCAPSSATPTSNDTRVRVDGFSKISATERPCEPVGVCGGIGLDLGRQLEQPGELRRGQVVDGEVVTRHRRGVYTGGRSARFGAAQPVAELAAERPRPTRGR